MSGRHRPCRNPRRKPCRRPCTNSPRSKVGSHLRTLDFDADHPEQFLDLFQASPLGQAKQFELEQIEPFAQTVPQQGWVALPHDTQVLVALHVVPELQVVPQQG